MRYHETIQIKLQELQKTVLAEEVPLLELGARLLECHEVLAHNGLSSVSINGGSNVAVEQEIATRATHAVAEGSSALLDLLGSMETHRNDLQTAGQVLDQVARKIKGFDNVADYFRALALNMRIRASMVPGAEGQFAPMVQSTLKLSGDIAVKSAELQELVSSNAGNGLHLVGSLDNVAKHLQDLLDSRSARESNVSEALLELLNRKMQGQARVDEQSKELERLFGELVVSLQFHDRLRQRVEHLVKTAEFGASHHDERVSQLLQRVNFAQVTEELANVLQLEQNISQALQKLDSSLEEWLASIVETNENMAVILGKLEATVMAYRDEYSRSEEQVSAAIAQVAFYGMAAQKIAEHLRIILDWKVEAKLLSLNSILIAGQLGSAGAGLRVLSQEIVATSDVLATIVEDLRVASEQMGVAGSSPRIHGCDSFQDALKDIAAIKGEMQATGSAKEQTIRMPLRQKMDEAKHALGCLTTLRRALEAAQVDIGNPGEQSALEIPSEVGCFLMGLYTMESERMVLKALCGGDCGCHEQMADVGADDNIELF